MVSPSQHVREESQELPKLLQLIGQAQKSIAIQLLSYNNKTRQGEDWLVLDNALIQAQKRGIKVDLMVSDWSTKGDKGSALRKLSQYGINIHIISVPEHPSGYIPYARTIHSKYMVVDQQHCWLGTSNWAKGYFFSSRNIGVVSYNSSVCQQLSSIHQELRSSVLRRGI